MYSRPAGRPVGVDIEKDSRHRMLRLKRDWIRSSFKSAAGRYPITEENEKPRITRTTRITVEKPAGEAGHDSFAPFGAFVAPRFPRAGCRSRCTGADLHLATQSCQVFVAAVFAQFQQIERLLDALCGE